jgi:serine protease inhibitor
VLANAIYFKGDWKYLYQLFCMERYASKEQAWVIQT